MTCGHDDRVRALAPARVLRPKIGPDQKKVEWTRDGEALGLRAGPGGWRKQVPFGYRSVVAPEKDDTGNSDEGRHQHQREAGEEYGPAHPLQPKGPVIGPAGH